MAEPADIKVTKAVREAQARGAAAFPERVKRAGDALLAAGIEAGDAASLAWLLDQTGQAARARRDLTPSLMTEVAAQAAELISTGPSARIRTWSGAGPLAGWVQVVTLRLATAVKGKEPRGSESDELADQLEAVGAGPELELLEKKYRPHVSKALTGALERLDRKQRGLLRMHYLEGASLESLAKLHRVHRATVARWLADAREVLLGAVRDSLVKAQGVARSEVESLVAVAHQGLELSLKRLLQTRSE